MSQLSISRSAIALSLASGLLLAGCASTSLQDPAPVTSASPATSAAPAASAQTAVAPVQAASRVDDAAGPTGTGRVVYFEYDSATIRPEFGALLDAHARFLRDHRERKLVVGGHTDERGGREYNLALGQQRADAVRRALGLLGVTASQVETISFGEEKPVSEAHEETAWSRNRRAELAYR